MFTVAYKPSEAANALLAGKTVRLFSPESSDIRNPFWAWFEVAGIKRENGRTLATVTEGRTHWNVDVTLTPTSYGFREDQWIFNIYPCLIRKLTRQTSDGLGWDGMLVFTFPTESATQSYDDDMILRESINWGVDPEGYISSQPGQHFAHRAHIRRQGRRIVLTQHGGLDI